jgi:hypothetical protein
MTCKKADRSECSARLRLRGQGKSRWVPVPLFLQIERVIAGGTVVLWTQQANLVSAYDAQMVVLALVFADGRSASFKLGELFTEDQGRRTASHYSWIGPMDVIGESLRVFSDRMNHRVTISLKDGAVIEKRDVDPKWPGQATQ